MAALVCDICGGKLVGKPGGIFECDSCGMEYSTEWAKEKIQEIKGTVRVEGTVEVAGTVRVDNSALIKNYSDMARNALDAGNFKEVEDYCNKILETDLGNCEAWFLKGKAVGWQSTIVNTRINETVNAFSKAIDCCPENSKEELKKKCKEELENLQYALLNLRIDRFTPFPDTEDIEGLARDVDSIINTAASFMNKTNVPLNVLGNLEYIDAINSGMCAAYESVHSEYIGANLRPDDGDFSRFLNRADYIIEGFNLALALCGDIEEIRDLNELKIQIYENLIHIQKDLKKSVSYNYTFENGEKIFKISKQLSNVAKVECQRLISEYTNKIDEIKTVGAQKVAAAIIRKRNAYWENHKDEKTALEKEKEELFLRIDELKTAQAAVPGSTELAGIKGDIAALEAKKKSISILKLKDRKAVQDQIDVLDKERRILAEKVNAGQNKIQDEINPLLNRIEAIDAEFEMER